LFPNRFWESVKTEHNHTPTMRQKQIYKHFEYCMEYAAQNRKGKRLVVVHNGDAIEGVHHGSTQVVTQNKGEQAEIHTELMDIFLRRVKFSRKNGDRLYYVSGTETHVGDKEQGIAKDLSAEKNPDGGRIFDHLELNINGRLVWFVHHGMGRGGGPNEGNALRNWLRDVYWDCKKVNAQPPDMVISGHTHTPTWNAYIARDENKFHMIHGVICPSWQAKTRFAYKVAPVERNEIGAAFVEVKADREITLPVILMMETKSRSAIAV
jgi:predicted phosphodiesterase